MILIAYDISKQKNRNNVIKELRNNDFNRLQNSLFIGDLKWKETNLLMSEINKIIDKKTDIISCFYLDEDNYKKGIMLGSYIDDYFLETISFKEI